MDYNNFDYQKLTQAVAELPEEYARVFTFGRSVLGKNLLCVAIGEGERKIFLNGAHHALEWITATLLASWCADYTEAIKNGGKIGCTDALSLCRQVTFFVAPMINPDGVDIVVNGLLPDNPRYGAVLAMLNGENPSEVWQANINGVDLNHNYDALFYEYASLARNEGYGSPGPRRYPGAFPFDQPETAAVRELVLAEEFPFAAAFHTQGEVIYWSFNGRGFEREGASLALSSGYALDTAEGISSYSGFKDWYLEKFDLPAFTVEAGKGQNPLPFEQFEQIKNDCYPLIAQCAQLAIS